jgi:cell division septation protein DedD
MSSDIKPEDIRDALAEQRDLDYDETRGSRRSTLPPIADDAADEDWGHGLTRASVASEEPSAFGNRRRLVMLALVGCAALLALAAVALVGFKVFDDEAADREVAVIEAEPTPEKVEPEEPGGMEVEHQDTLLLNEQAGSEAATEVEQLLPPPEEPMARTEVESAAAQQDQQAGDAAPLVTPGTQGAPEAEQVAAAPPAASTASLDQPVPARFEGTPFAIQFASLRTMDSAEDMWRRLQGTYPELLSDMALNVDHVDLGDRGVFYRVQAGPLPNRATAEDMCGQLKARQQDCIVVAR